MDKVWLTYCCLSCSIDRGLLRDGGLSGQLRSGEVWRPSRESQWNAAGASHVIYHFVSEKPKSVILLKREGIR